MTYWFYQEQRRGNLCRSKYSQKEEQICGSTTKMKKNVLEIASGGGGWQDSKKSKLTDNNHMMITQWVTTLIPNISVLLICMKYGKEIK
jgi:hypothetical protein